MIFINFVGALTLYLENGIKDEFNAIYAFTNAHIVNVKNEIANATLIIQGKKIVEIGTAISIPENAIVYDLKGDYIYPSFIDLYSDYGLTKPQRGEYVYRPQYESKKEGPYHWNEAIHPEINAAEKFKYNKKQASDYLNSGFGIVLSHQQDGIAIGTACLVSLSDEKEQKSILSEKSASCFSFKKGASRQKYPSSLMGCISLLNQLFID